MADLAELASAMNRAGYNRARQDRVLDEWLAHCTLKRDLEQLRDLDWDVAARPSYPRT